MWKQIERHLFQLNKAQTGYTGYYRCVGGQLADGTWPTWFCEAHRTR